MKFSSPKFNYPILCCLLSFSNFSFAQLTEDTTFFTTGNPYSNNARLSKTLTVANAEEIEVSVSGTTEKCCDYLRISDINGREIEEFRGSIKRTLSIKGSSIKVFFYSDGRTPDEGVEVRVSARTPASVFAEIKGNLLEVTTIILEEGTRDAFVSLQNSVERLKNLNAEIVQAQDTGLVLSRVTQELNAISEIYKAIAEGKATILKAHQRAFENLQTIKNRTQNMVEKLTKEQQEYQRLLDETNRTLNASNSNLEKQKLQFALSGYQTIANSLQIQQEIWVDFQKMQNTLEERLRAHSQKIEVLLYILEINSKIYKQAANVASLQRSSIGNLNEMINLTELRQVISEIAENERDIQSWMSRIKKTDFK